MMRILLLACLSFIFMVHSDAAEKVIWKGEVSSNGKPSDLITLTIHKKYQIKVQGYVNLGKWIQNKEELANDACYEFNKMGETTKLEAFRNSHDISVCDGTYHPNHIYQSQSFAAKQDRIHFWVYDTSYDDNKGTFFAEVIEIE